MTIEYVKSSCYSTRSAYLLLYLTYHESALHFEFILASYAQQRQYWTRALCGLVSLIESDTHVYKTTMVTNTTSISHLSQIIADITKSDKR